MIRWLDQHSNLFFVAEQRELPSVSVNLQTAKLTGWLASIPRQRRKPDANAFRLIHDLTLNIRQVSKCSV